MDGSNCFTTMVCLFPFEIQRLLKAPFKRRRTNSASGEVRTIVLEFHMGLTRWPGF